MTAIRLSICIPTYNFGPFLAHTLRAVAAQATDEVEIVVLDGGSTDHTPEVVAQFARVFPRLIAQRLDRPGGIDADIARTVALATGEYCWLMSSDDAPAPGAVAAVLDALATGDDVYLCDRVECDRDLRPLRTASWLVPGSGREPFRFSEDGELDRYLAAARSVGALFSYMSSIVVRRSAWDAHPPTARVMGTHYAHAARLFVALRAGASLRHLSGPLVLCRGENDSFARGGVVRRFLIDLDGYLAIADELGLEGARRAAFLGVMRLEHPWYVFAEIRSRVSSAEEWRLIEAKLLAFGYRRRQLRAVDALGTSRAAMALARFGWFGLRRLRRALPRRR